MKPMLRPPLPRAVLLGLLPLAAACGTKSNPGGNCPIAPAPVVFQAVQKQVLAQCTPCHSQNAINRYGAPASVNFDSYDDAVKQADSANIDIISGRMPPGQALDDASRCVFDAWMKNNYAK